MGSMIHLAVGRLEVDWGKNSGFTDHSALFQQTDLVQIPYYYVGQGPSEIDNKVEEKYEIFTKYKDGLSKPLGQVVDRLELLGYTLRQARSEFDFLSEFNSFSTYEFPFEALAAALSTVDVYEISADYGDGEDFGDFFRRHIFDRIGLAKFVKDPDEVKVAAAEAMENLSPYAILRLLAENPDARQLPVNWQFADVEYAGWAKRAQFVKDLDTENRFLIVTEGSSDAGILKHAFNLLMPHIADFFQFVDMQEGYPFTGTGNLYRFTQGLISIGIQNKVIILYDNDAEGTASYVRSLKLNLPHNMRVLKLPDLQDFKRFKTIGPHGTRLANINGRAAAIECYLDLGSDPIVRWNNFNKDTQDYQGELVGKTEFARKFYDLTSYSSEYDFRKLTRVLQHIVFSCVEMREALALQQLGSEPPW
ncbi:HEPN/Toprim-associated domain-containing protein [Microvirga terrae]|uniref:HEPN/Toprim-associated domain-containing protein n=1 Tax=Microvirga terrae TaxID=2740529 RepID=A0ABY5RKR0_9HYPH|nr:HEPN/Toprim-associated domain-containing protein [Microvirga terrae]UVF17790.1 HEPN/Toprim-associated domain-containing protein [Microvirga terrae]